MVDDAALTTEPEAAPEPDADTEHAEAVAQLNAIIAASRAAQDAAHATRVEAAMVAVADVVNPFTGLTVPEPAADKSTVSVDEAYREHLMREAAEEREYREQLARDAAPRAKKNPFERLRKAAPKPPPSP